MQVKGLECATFSVYQFGTRRAETGRRVAKTLEMVACLRRY
jgi:hypothetical protein